MFERLSARAQRAAEARARTTLLELAERIRSEAPSGIRVEAGAGGIKLSGRALRRRFALDPALRWLIARLR